LIYVLFSPSESKRGGGSSEKMRSLLFSLNRRSDIIDRYRQIVISKDSDKICDLFGLKSLASAQKYLVDIDSSQTLTALKRYSGVAYEHLDIETLLPEELEYLYSNTIIFSNLFGPIMGGDKIPIYKIKQTNKIGDIEPHTYYKKLFQDSLDDMLDSSEILDLRAGYYKKFYSPKQIVTTCKFLKDGRVVSHYAKAYRGIMLRLLAQHRCTNIDELLALEIETLQVERVVESKKSREIVYSIV